jgi:putative transposase
VKKNGTIIRNLEEVRAAVVEFKDRYNRHWRLEKLGFISPHEARQAATLNEAT